MRTRGGDYAVCGRPHINLAHSIILFNAFGVLNADFRRQTDSYMIVWLCILVECRSYRIHTFL